MDKKTLKEAQRIMASKGGNATLKKYGKEHYSAMGKKGAPKKKKSQ